MVATDPPLSGPVLTWTFRGQTYRGDGSADLLLNDGRSFPLRQGNPPAPRFTQPVEPRTWGPATIPEPATETAAITALERLTPEERARVLRYARERWAL